MQGVRLSGARRCHEGGARPPAAATCRAAGRFLIQCLIPARWHGSTGRPRQNARIRFPLVGHRVTTHWTMKTVGSYVRTGILKHQQLREGDKRRLVAICGEATWAICAHQTPSSFGPCPAHRAVAGLNGHVLRHLRVLMRVLMVRDPEDPWLSTRVESPYR